MGYNLGPLFTAVNSALAEADRNFGAGQHPPPWPTLQQAMRNLNQFLNSTDSQLRSISLTGGQRLAFPFVSSFANGNSVSAAIPFTASYTQTYQYAGNLYIHVDVETPSSPCSWQIVTGFEIDIWATDSTARKAADAVGGGPSSSSSYYASSSSPTPEL